MTLSQTSSLTWWTGPGVGNLSSRSESDSTSFCLDRVCRTDVEYKRRPQTGRSPQHEYFTLVLHLSCDFYSVLTLRGLLTREPSYIQKRVVEN